MRKAGFCTEKEAETFKSVQELLELRFGEESESGERGCAFTPEETQTLRELSRAVMAELALWIRDFYVRSHVVKGQP